ncbi:MAG: sigma-70 family RNA polymerase sigma factor [Deltaproteobacteria bacterium]
MDELDDVTLGRARRKDPDAQRQLIRFYQPRVGALLFRMLGRGSPDVVDAAQETFERVVRALERFDPKGPAKLSTWILTIATRIAIDRLRKPSVDAEVIELVDRAPSPESRVASMRLVDRVEAEMMKLPDDTRAALVLRAYHDLDYAEIARIQAVEIGTVKSRIARARAALASVREEER